MWHQVAAQQRGTIARAQLRAAGLGDDVIDRRIARGELVPLHRGVYAIAGSPDSFERQLTAALLAAGQGAVASHSAAAVLHGMGEIRGRVEISVLHGRRPRLEGVHLHRVSYLPREHTVMCHGIRATNPARTLCDLAAPFGARLFESLLDQALARRRVTRRELVVMLESLPRTAQGKPWLRRLLAARPEGKARAESPLEAELHDLLHRAGIEGWVPQYQAAGCRIDVAFPREKLAVQADSYLHHSSRSDWARDKKRVTALVTEGWRVLPVTSEDLRPGHELVLRIRAALACRSRDSSPLGAR
ncbi:MAG TPA: type IV toxin-antitoxin system AbiEi family antitoxin domain-containing protein [Planctomycetota bacterium]|nr:type IV toxin-antitoxin system AbiEi family antitoxin domain-containing protein [Planctomycetota bacterium]